MCVSQTRLNLSHVMMLPGKHDPVELGNEKMALTLLLPSCISWRIVKRQSEPVKFVGNFTGLNILFTLP